MANSYNQAKARIQWVESIVLNQRAIGSSSASSSSGQHALPNLLGGTVPFAPIGTGRVTEAQIQYFESGAGSIVDTTIQVFETVRMTTPVALGRDCDTPISLPASCVGTFG